MIYAPRALRHFGLAAMEGRESRAPERARAVPPKAVPPKVVPMTMRARRVRPMGPARSRTVVRLWLPMTFIFLLLAPFALLLAPLIYLAPGPYGDRPLATVLGVGQVLLSLGGTVVDVDTPEALVRIRIF
jgi:hypothetical protein